MEFKGQRGTCYVWPLWATLAPAVRHALRRRPSAYVRSRSRFCRCVPRGELFVELAHSVEARGLAQGAKTCPTSACFESKATGRVGASGSQSQSLAAAAGSIQRPLPLGVWATRSCLFFII